MTLLDGKALAKDLNQQLKDKIASLVTQGHRRPHLAVIHVGADEASDIYVSHKVRACSKANIESSRFDFDDKVSQATLLQKIDELNKNPEVDGILVQLPLPKQINADAVAQSISPTKDVDGFNPLNLGMLLRKTPTMRPCTPMGVMRLLEHYKINPTGKKAVIVGASNIVGRPMALELLMANATVTICHSKTQDIKEEVMRADIIVSAVGQPGLIKGDWIAPEAVVIDIGITRTKEGKLTGDVEFKKACENAAFITPVPGGIGPMTVAMLLENTFNSYCAKLSQ